MTIIKITIRAIMVALTWMIRFTVFVCLKSLCVTLLWNWAISPMLGLPTMLFKYAVGIVLLLGVMSFQYKVSITKKTDI